MDYVLSVKKLAQQLNLQPQTDIPRRKASTSSGSPKLLDAPDDVFKSGARSSFTEDEDRSFVSRQLLRTRRKSREEQRRPLSVARSVPLSPKMASNEQLQRRMYDLCVNTDLLTSELMAMKKTDQEIARRLLQIHSEIRMLKLKKSCMRHSILLDEAMYEAELADEFPTVCDSHPKYMSKVLQSHGVTRMNIHARRFSCS